MADHVNSSTVSYTLKTLELEASAVLASEVAVNEKLIPVPVNTASTTYTLVLDFITELPVVAVSPAVYPMKSPVIMPNVK